METPGNAPKLPWLRISSRRVQQWIVVMATLLVWGHTAAFDFVWDDRQFIVELEAIRSFKHIPSMFWDKDAQASIPDFNVFRPLRTVHYAVLFALGGGEPPKPWLFHMANVLWHGATALLLLGVARRLGERLMADVPRELLHHAALFAAIAFVVHPVVSEVVCWAKSLDDEMAAAFTLAAMRSLLRWNGGDRGCRSGWLWFTLAVYSKVSAVPFALVVALMFKLVHKLDWKSTARHTSAFLLIAAVFMAHRHYVIGQSSQTAPISGTHAQTLIDMLPVTGAYTRLLMGVPPFHIDYSFMKGGHALTSMRVLGGVFWLAILTGAMIAGLRSARWRLAGLGLAWCGLFLLPVSNLLPMMQYMAERFLYLPLIGWLLILMCLSIRLLRVPWAAWTWVVLALLWAGTAWHRSWIWKDRLSLFVQSQIEGPPTERVRNNAISAIFALPPVKAVFTGQQAETERLVIHPQATREALETALGTLTEVESLFQEDASFLNSLGVLRAMTGRQAEAVSAFATAAKLRPQRADIWANLGQAQLEMGRHEEALAALDKAVQLDSRHVSAWQSLLRLHWEQSQFNEVLRCLDQLQSLQPGNADHRLWRERALEKLKPPQS